MNKSSILPAYSFILMFLFLAKTTTAHFGSKGPFGGTVSCAITQDSFIYIGTANGGVFESTTKALTAWRARPVGLTSGKITALAHSGSYLFAATADSGIFIFNGYVGSDRYWNKINNGLATLRIRSLLALDSITVLAGTDGNGLFKTTDKGATWTVLNSIIPINNSTVTGLVKAGNRILLIAENKGVFASDDNGVTWTDFNDVNTLNVPATHALSYNSNADILIVSNANGLFTVSSASTAHVPSYSPAQAGLPSNTTIRSISNNDTDWYLATDKGIYTSSVNTINWVAVNNGLPNTDATSIVASQDRLIAGIANEGIFKAASGTYNWAAFNSNFNNPVTHTMTAGGDSLIVAVTNKGIFISKDLATSYTSANNGLTDSLHINDIILADVCLLAATKNDGVFFSVDTGKTWVAINTGLANLNIKKLFYANGYKYAIDIAGNLFESPLYSGNWTAIQGGLPSGTTPTSLTFYGGKLVLGTLGNGIFMREQKGGTWTANNNGLTNLNVTSVTASGNKWFAGTNGSGVFVSDAHSINWHQASPTSIAHTTMMGLNGDNIQAMESYAGYVYASYKGGLLTTSDNGATWIAGGNQFNLPSFTDVNKICFVSTRVFVPTENNAVYSNSLSELPALPETIILSHENISMARNADTAVISITSNRSWTVSSNQPWLTANMPSGFRNNDLMITALANSGTPRTGTITITAGSLTKTINVSQDGETGTDETNALQATLDIYPNPGRGLFTIAYSKSNAVVKTIAVYSITGHLLKEVPVEADQKQVKLVADYPSGIYFVHLNTDRGIAIRKISIQ